MDYLWKKQSPNGEYINFFDTIRTKYDSDFDRWDKLLSGTLKWLNTYDTMEKCNKKSLDKLREGHRRFLVRNFKGAIVSYNQSLCYAQADSVNESLIYLNRAECFFEMGSYRQALIDIDLASQWKHHSKRVMNRLTRCKTECHQYLQMGLQPVITPPQLSFEANRNIPCMANVLAIRTNGEFGRHIVAKCDIDAGKIIMVTDIFAAGTVQATGMSSESSFWLGFLYSHMHIYVCISLTELCCRNCNKIDQNLIPCLKCSNTMFCSGKCSQRQGVHRLECKSFFHVISDTSLKLAIETVLIAIEMFPTIEDLMKFVNEIIQQDYLSKRANDRQSQYGFFLKLHQSYSEKRIYQAYQTYTILLAIPAVKHLFNTEKRRTFLLHLSLHHLTVLPQNVFHEIRFHRDWISSRYVYDVMSL